MPRPKKSARVLADPLLRSRRRSVFRGMARLGDLNRVVSHDDLVPLISKTDSSSLRDVWNSVGEGLSRAMGTFEQERKAS